MTIENDDILKLVVRDEFSFTPGPREIKEGEFSGEVFRSKHLHPALKTAIANQQKLEVVLDGTAGYGTSFLEEAFGGLIRNDDISYEAIQKYLVLVTEEEPELADDIEQYLHDAKEAKAS